MKNSTSGFSLIEVAIAVGIVGVMVSVCLGILSLGLANARKAEDLMATGIVFEDARNRLRGHHLVEGPLPGSPWYYTESGNWISPVSSAETPEKKFYRVSVELVRPRSGALRENAPGMMAARMELIWPVHEETGEPTGTGEVDRGRIATGRRRLGAKQGGRRFEEVLAAVSCFEQLLDSSAQAGVAPTRLLEVGGKFLRGGVLRRVVKDLQIGHRSVFEPTQRGLSITCANGRKIVSRKLGCGDP